VELKNLKISCDVIYATSTPATPSLSINAKQAADRLKRFSTGEIQVLFATSVAEEGMDIPAANCVIRFDAIQSTVSLVQSRGPPFFFLLLFYYYYYFLYLKFSNLQLLVYSFLFFFR
jgi:predicted helicase